METTSRKRISPKHVAFGADRTDHGTGKEVALVIGRSCCEKILSFRLKNIVARVDVCSCPTGLAYRQREAIQLWHHDQGVRA